MFRRKLLAPTIALGLLAGAAPASAAPPANDGFEHAAALGQPAGQVTATIDEATRQAGEPAHGGQSVWFAYRPSTSQRVAVDVPSNTSGSNIVVAVYTGPAVSSLRRIGQSEGYVPRVPFDAQGGETYWIAIASNYETSGTQLQLRVRPIPLPANDSFADARKVGVPGRYTGNLADATAELGEPSHQRGVRPSRSVWFRFTARRSGRLSIQAVSAGCTSPVTVYTGTALDSLHRVGGSTGTFRFRARRGRTYRIAVDCDSPTLGDYELTISDGSIAGKGVALSIDPGQTVRSVRSSGLHVEATARRKVHVRVELVVGAREARRLGVDRVLGRTRGTLDYNQSLPAVIRLTGKAGRRLDGVASVRAVVRLTLLKTDAPNRVLLVPVTLPN
jgi:hypothetical protein